MERFIEQIQVLGYFSTYSPPELRHLSYHGTYFVSLFVVVCRLGLETQCDTHLRLSVILKTLTLTQGRLAHKGQMGQAHPKNFR